MRQLIAHPGQRDARRRSCQQVAAQYPALRAAARSHATVAGLRILFEQVDPGPARQHSDNGLTIALAVAHRDLELVSHPDLLGPLLGKNDNAEGRYQSPTQQNTEIILIKFRKDTV